MDAYYLANSKGKNLYYSGARPHVRTLTFCRATSDVLIVTANGELTACYEVFDRSHVLSDDFIIGKIDLEKGIILTPGKREALFGKIEENRARCEGCFCYFHCAGDCPPKAFIANLHDDEFRCSVAREITKELILERIASSNGVWQGGLSNRIGQSVYQTIESKKK
jgi:radical SAM protein with 4Fe4S-binding SPASM domain